MNTMSNETRTLQPGFLVSLKTVLSGNVKYKKVQNFIEQKTSDGALQARWESERLINDPVEFERGKVARGKCRALITGICANSAFGLLCPESRIADLEKAIDESRKVANEFNDTARLSRIGVYVIKGRIARDDVEAVAAISSEMRDLMSEMQDGIRELDTKKIRDAANKARNVGAMLSPQMQEKLQVAIDIARSTARRITKAGESAAVEIDNVAINKIDQSRLAFLDMAETDAPAPVPATPVESDMDARALDFEPAENPEDVWAERANAAAALYEKIDSEETEKALVTATAAIAIPQFEI